MSYCVLDSSALLAWLQDEPGQAQVDQLIANSEMSTVNWSEVLQKNVQHGIDTNKLTAIVKALGLSILAFDEQQAQIAAKMWPLVKPAGLSLADRCCLALAQQQQLPVLTTDRNWVDFQDELGIQVKLIR